MRLRVDSIRARLALGYALLLAVALSAMAVATYSLLNRLAARGATLSQMETATAVLSAAGRAPGRMEQAVRRFRAPDRRLVLIGPDGTLIAESVPGRFGPPVPEEVFVPVQPRALLAALPAGRSRSSTLVRLRAGDPPVRVTAMRTRRTQGMTLVVIGSTAPDRALRERARTALAIAVAVSLLVTIIPGSLLVRRSLAPVGSMTQKAARIGAARLDERLPVRNPRDELGALALVLNDLLDRLQRAFELQRRFMAEAAHELRTPVAVVRAEAELALSGERTPEEYREALAVVGGEAERLGRIVDDLLTFSRAEAGQYPLRQAALDLGEVAADAARALRTLAAQKGVEVTADASDELPMEGDENLLRRMVVNLVENAIKHGRPGDQVRVHAVASPEGHRLTVRDTGPGVPADAQARIFEPFYRGSQARADGAAAGAGLGLPIARWIAEAHGGRLALAESGPAGSVFVATFPRPAA